MQDSIFLTIQCPTRYAGKREGFGPGTRALTRSEAFCWARRETQGSWGANKKRQLSLRLPTLGEGGPSLNKVWQRPCNSFIITLFVYIALPTSSSTPSPPLTSSSRGRANIRGSHNKSYLSASCLSIPLRDQDGPVGSLKGPPVPPRKPARPSRRGRSQSTSRKSAEGN